MRGGARKGAGRKPLGPDHIPTTEKMCIKISCDNARWLRSQKGKGISKLIDLAVTAWRKR